MDTLLAAQPQSYRQLIKHSFALYRAGFAKVFLLAIVTAFIAFIPRLLSDRAGYPLFMNQPPTSFYSLFAFITNLVSLLFFIAIIWHMYCEMRNVREPLIEDLTMGARKLLYSIIAIIIENLIICAVILIAFGFLIYLKSYHLLFYFTLADILFTWFVFVAL